MRLARQLPRKVSSISTRRDDDGDDGDDGDRSSDGGDGDDNTTKVGSDDDGDDGSGGGGDDDDDDRTPVSRWGRCHLRKAPLLRQLQRRRQHAKALRHWGWAQEARNKTLGLGYCRCRERALQRFGPPSRLDWILLRAVRQFFYPCASLPYDGSERRVRRTIHLSRNRFEGGKVPFASPGLRFGLPGELWRHKPRFAALTIF